MNIKIIEDRIYFFADEQNSIEINRNILKTFCNNIKNLNLCDFINYCQNKQTSSEITEEDIIRFCSTGGEVPLPEPIIGVGDIPDFIEGDDQIPASDLERRVTLEFLLDELNVPCINKSLSVADKIKEYTDDLEIYEPWKKELPKLQPRRSAYPDTYMRTVRRMVIINNVRRVSVKRVRTNFTNPKLSSHRLIRRLLNRFPNYESLLNDFDEELSNPDTSDVSFDAEYGQSLHDNLINFLDGKSTDELDDLKPELENRRTQIDNLIDDLPDYSGLSKDELDLMIDNDFKSTLFYKNTQERISLLKVIIQDLIQLSTNQFILSVDKRKTTDLLKTAQRLLEIHEYQLNGFLSDMKNAGKECPVLEENERPEFTELLPEIQNDHQFEVTNQPITIEDRAYWVKYAKLATILSTVAFPFWSTGINILGVPIPLPTIYINLGVIKVELPVPDLGVNLRLPFLVVPFLAITGIVVSPYFMLINMSNIPIGPVAPLSKVCLFTWRSALTMVKKGIESKELKPFVIPSGPLTIDTATDITQLLSILIRDDLPPYKRLKLSNIPFTIFSLLNVIKIQRRTTGLP